jgi:hypothetical protein
MAKDIVAMHNQWRFVEKLDEALVHLGIKRIFLESCSKLNAK